MRLLRGATVCLVLLSTGAQAEGWGWPWASADESANKLFVEAVPLWNQYQALPEEDPAQYEARLQLLNQIDENLKSILQDYPESSLAVELVSTRAIKQLDQEQIEAEIPRLQQSIPASALMAELLQLEQKYQALPQDDPAQYEARLKLLTQVDVDVDRILKDYPLSYEAKEITLTSNATKQNISEVEQSISAKSMIVDIIALWDKYKVISTDDPAKFETRLNILMKIDENFKSIISSYPESRAAVGLQKTGKIGEISVNYVQNYKDQLTCSLYPAACALNRALEITNKINRGEQDYSEALSYIAEAQAVSGNINESIKTAETIFKTHFKDEAFELIARAQAASGDVSGAQDTIKLIEFGGRGVGILEADMKLAVGDIEGAKRAILIALQDAGAIVDRYDRNYKFYDIALSQAKMGDIAGAQETEKQIIYGSDSEYKFFGAEVASAIAEAQSVASDIEGARKTISDAMKKAEAIQDDFDRNIAVMYIARSQAKIGDVSEALATANKINRSENLEYALSYIAGGQAKNGNIADAFKTVDAISDDLMRVKALTNIVSSILSK